MLDIWFNEVHELLRAGNTRARGSTFAVVLTSPIAGTQPICLPVDPPGNLDVAGPLGKVRGLDESRRKYLGVWGLRARLIAEHHSVPLGARDVSARLWRQKGAKHFGRH